MRDGEEGHLSRDRVLLLDPVAPRAYSDRTLRAEAMGGAEATVVRVAGGLARHRQVVVAQSARAHAEAGADGVLYLPWSRDEPLPGMRDAPVVVVLRAHKLLPRIREQYPHARLFLWLHSFPGHRRKALALCARKAGATIVTVSETHRRAVVSFALAKDPTNGPWLDVIRIYNPVSDTLVPDDTEHNPDKLLFSSAPHKGLDEVLDAFRFLHHRWPRLRLFIASPGPFAHAMPQDLRGVVPLGPLTHAEAIRHLRESLCLFYPQASFQETFGLVFAEANAVGTPVLAHASGAAAEVIDGSREQLIHARDHEGIAHVIERWRAGARPIVTTKPAFRLSQVILDWEAAFARPWNPAGVSPHGTSGNEMTAAP